MTFVMNRLSSIDAIRLKLKQGGYTVGSWMQIPHPSVAEIMGDAGYDWVAIDMEHGAISHHQLPDLFRALELGNTLPLARIPHGDPTFCKQALDAGAGGVIVPMINNASQLIAVRDSCRWPSAGKRGVGFSRANLFGKYFDSYIQEAQAPILVAMIEDFTAVHQLDQILDVKGLDAILIGPYDLSASLGLTAMFDHPEFCEVMTKIRNLAASKSVACGIHVVDPSPDQLKRHLDDGYRFVAHSIDAVFLTNSLGPSGFSC